MKVNKLNIMRKIIYAAVAAMLILLSATDAKSQSIAGVKSRLAVGQNQVTVVEQSDAAEAVRAVEQRTKRTKVNGYTILLLSDNSHQARENAVKAKEQFEESFPGIEVEMYYESPSFYVTAGRYLTKEEAIIELWRFRGVFPKAITQSREMDIEDFIVEERATTPVAATATTSAEVTAASDNREN